MQNRPVLSAGRRTRKRCIGYSGILLVTATDCASSLGSGKLFGISVLPLATEGGWYTPMA